MSDRVDEVDVLARSMFTVAGKLDLYERYMLAINAADVPALVAMLEELPAPSLEPPAAHMFMNTFAISSSRSILWREPSWRARRDAIIAVYEKGLGELPPDDPFYQVAHSIYLSAKSTVSDPEPSGPSERIET